MSISEVFVRRPVATTLFTAGIVLAGVTAYFRLAVSPFPQVDSATITVSASMAGASPETMATTVATPLERHLGTIADVTEMTSSSSVGSTNVTLQFGLNRDIDGAARDVQAAIVAARIDLPQALRSNPSYRKQNPADAPIMIMALTSKTMTSGQLYDEASTKLAQKLSQVAGVGNVGVFGSSLPAVRVELNPSALFKYGVGLEDVRAALAAANANSPKGAIENEIFHWQIYDNDQSRVANDYRSLVVAYRNGAPIRLTDVADVEDSVEDTRNLGLSKGNTAVLVSVSRQPQANIIQTVDLIRGMLPQLRAQLPAATQLDVAVDRSVTIRASLRDVARSLAMAMVLVVLVVYLFLRDGRATLIPAVAVPVSLIGTFGVMYLLNFSLDNLSLMALTIATGFVVDDAIVVMENITRHMESGTPRFEATLVGVRQVAFTVLSMSLSLIAVFIPILLMGGQVGRVFREFAITLSVAILISMVISLTTTPMMCARLLAIRHPGEIRGRFHRWTEAAYEGMLDLYRDTLDWSLRHSFLMIIVLACTVGLNVWLFTIIPKGLFPEEDTGRLGGGIQADQTSSFQRMSQKLRQFTQIVQSDPDVDDVVGYTGAGGRGGNTGQMFVSAKPLRQRKASSEQIIARLRPKLAQVPGAQLFLFPQQETPHAGGRMSNSTWQYTLQSDSLSELREWTPKLLEALKSEPALIDLNSDQQDRGLETDLVIDRDTASRLGLTAAQIDSTLSDAFGQRQVSTIYESLNQYHVVMVVAQRFWQEPSALRDIYVSSTGGTVSGTQSTNAVAGTVSGFSGFPVVSTTSSSASSAGSVAADTARNASINAIASTGHGGASTGQAVSTRHETMVPLSSFTHYALGTTPLSVNHQNSSVAATISFNLVPEASLSDAVLAVDRQTAAIQMPSSIHGSFQGTAKTYQDTVGSELVLILAAIIAIYLVLGILYESYSHPFTILSTLPSAGIGAVLALMMFNLAFSLIALIGVLLLIGIVKKNAIMMIDFAIDAERSEGLSPRDAIFKACQLRFRPILMTTMAAILGAVPLAVGYGDGAELRQPLGISIVGGLVVSQMLTLYTTPVVYLYVDRARHWFRRASVRVGIADDKDPEMVPI
ncbi:MAG TPA: efflux RND transporter permease subunit [Opitutaceae bacterium]|nr:efflux RND transporter permease subunit [Opitutaceae bacterium]